MRHEKKLATLLAKYKKILGLDDYKINSHIVTGGDDFDSYAEVVSRVYENKEFRIIFNADKLGKELEDTVAHELIHVLLYGLTDLMENIINVTDLSVEQRERISSTLLLREHEIVESIIPIILDK